MNIQFLDQQQIDPQECTPCESSPYPHTACYWPNVRMSREYLPESGREQLRLAVSNPWANLILRDVKIAFLAVTPNVLLSNGRPPVTLGKDHNIDCGDIIYAGENAQGTVRYIPLLDEQWLPEGRQFHVGISFNACQRKNHQSQYSGYVLLKSGLLKYQEATKELDRAA